MSVDAVVAKVELMTVWMEAFSAIALICTGQIRILLLVVVVFFILLILSCKDKKD